MASAFSHAAAALALATVLAPASQRHSWNKSVYVLGAACAAVPDLDVIGFAFGISYGDVWGHRGMTHSLLFAAILATAVSALISLHSIGRPVTLSRRRRRLLWLYLFAATASHGLLDALTNGGLGVALFSPFDSARYFFPWRPIEVSPIGVGAFFSNRGWEVLASELRWILIPSAMIGSVALLLRRRASGGLRATTAE
jgi:inner membrane protein